MLADGYFTFKETVALQTVSYRYIHTHLRNAVPLVWGLLRLAPIRIPYNLDTSVNSGS